MLNLVFFDYPFIHIDRFCITLSSFFIMLFFLLSNGAHWYFWEKKYPKKGLSILWSEAKIIWKPKLFLLLGEYMFCFFLYWLQTFTGNPKNTVSIITLAEDYLRYESLIYLLLLFFSLGTFSFHHGKERYLCMFDRVCNGIFNHTSLCQFYQGRLLLQVTIPFEEKPTSNLPGDNLRYYRQRKSLTTRQLAEQIDVVPATILMYEQNKHPIPFDVANSLADALDVNADLLYDDFAVFLVTPYSEALKDIRMSIGMSQRAFAEHIGVIPSYYYKLESGHRRPSRKVYQRMVDTLSHTHPHHSLFAQHKLQSK